MQNGTGRASGELAAVLRREVTGGSVVPGEFLPTERALSESHGVARKTVRRALGMLEDEGLVARVPRRGYRVLASVNDPDRGAPIAYLFRSVRKFEALTARYKAQLGCFQKAAADRGWSMLMITAENRTHRQMVEQARVARASAAVLDAEEPELIRMTLETCVPAVMVDAWRPEFEVDSVMQDGNQGGLLAAGYLASRGHKRVAVIVPRIRDAHSVDRFGGAVAGLARAGIGLPEEFKVVAGVEEEVEKQVRRLLRRRERPTAFIVPWTNLSVATWRAACAAGLVYRKDFELVGWSPEELYDEIYAARFEGEPVPPAITWSMETMARVAVGRLAERRADPGMPTLRMKIPVKLRADSE